MKLIEPTYTQIAVAIANSTKQLAFLDQERTRIQKEYAQAEPEDGSFLQFVGQKLVDSLTLAIDNLKACSQSDHELMSQKLAEPVAVQLNLGLGAQVLSEVAA